MATYRGKPVEAVQWFPPGHPRYPGPHPAVEMLFKADRTFHAAYLRRPRRLAIPAQLELNPGDWIVTNPRNNQTTLFKQAAFEELYEPA